MSGNKRGVAPSVSAKAADAADEAPLREFASSPGDVGKYSSGESERAITGDEKRATAAGKDREIAHGAGATAVGRAELEPPHAYSSDGANRQVVPVFYGRLSARGLLQAGMTGAEHILYLKCQGSSLDVVVVNFIA